MKTRALESLVDLARPGKPSAARPDAVLAQRRSSLGPGMVAAPPIRDGGQPLDPGTRTTMESGFGRDFGRVRVHDDALAHDNARSLGARAYAAGDHVVFAEGAYRPETPAGRSLLAHELAHTVQQSGVQMKMDGSVPAARDAELETQADRAAGDVATGRRASALSTIDRPAVFRTDATAPAGGSATTPMGGPAQNLPAGMIALEDEPPGIGTTALVVGVTDFTLPLEKGQGDWVQKAYDEAAGGERLLFTPIIQGSSVAAYKEDSKTEEYKSVWLNNFGFTTTRGLAAAFQSAAATNDEVKTALADAGVKKLVSGLKHDLKTSECDIDHIVEKQMGGTSIPSNLQLLTKTKNQKSGRETYQKLKGLVEQVRDHKMRGTGVRKLQLKLQKATVPSGTPDPSFVVESLLRKGAVKGSDAVKDKTTGAAVMLSAGGVGETVRVRDSGPTTIDHMAKRIVPGMRLNRYVRAKAGGKNQIDTVEGELDNLALSRSGAKNATVVLSAEPAAAGTTAGAAAGGEAATENAAATEGRVLKLDKTRNSKIAFYYPYLSPGTLTSSSLDAAGNLTGEGVIKPSVPFLGDLHIRYGPDLLEVVAPLTADKLKSPIPGFRFTEGKLALTLSPAFVPNGALKFEIGPERKPVMVGEIAAKYESGAFVATGTLKPGAKLPGVKDAAGDVEYHSEKGWSGKLKATSSVIPNADIDAELGFTSSHGQFHAYGGGGIKTKIKDSDLILRATWHGGPVNYAGHVTVPKPLPLVDKVRLEGEYENEQIRLKGEAAIKFKGITSTMTIGYRRKDREDGKFSGKASIAVKLPKADGHLDLQFDEAGKFWGEGTVSYQLTKNLRPTLGVKVTPEERIKIMGEVVVADVTLVKMWPSAEGGKLQFFKDVGVKFSVPTPVPGVTAFGRVTASAGLATESVP